jgi:hypothetical protein
MGAFVPSDIFFPTVADEVIALCHNIAQTVVIVDGIMYVTDREGVVWDMTVPTISKHPSTGHPVGNRPNPIPSSQEK